MDRIESLVNEVAKKINKIMPDLQEAEKMFAQMEKEYGILKEPSEKNMISSKALQQIAYAEVSQNIEFYQKMLTETLDLGNFSIEEVLYLKEEIQKKLDQENARLVLDIMLAPTLERLEKRQGRS